MMILTSMEKLFQAMEYVQQPVKEDLKRRLYVHLSEALGFESQIDKNILRVRETMMTSAL